MNFEECIIVFGFLYTSKCYRFLKSVLSFSKPQLNFQKIKMSRILLSISLNFGCSSCIIIYYRDIERDLPAITRVIHQSRFVG